MSDFMRGFTEVLNMQTVGGLIAFFISLFLIAFNIAIIAGVIFVIFKKMEHKRRKP